LLRRYQTLFGPSFDARQAIADVRGHLPLFIDAEFRDPVMGTSWSQHVHDWMREPRPNVVPISYEALKADTETALSDVMTRLTGEPADPRLVTLSVARHEFELASGRQPGQEVRQEFLRKGVVGDWRSHFTLEASDVFERHAGAELVQLGYETDSSWVGASERED
jgi:hypothetical protein